MPRRSHRGFTFITFLMLLGGLAAVGWIVVYGPAYWDNVGVSRMLKEAANMCYLQPDDERVRGWIFSQLQQDFSTGERGSDGLPALSIDVQRDDIRIERTDKPKWVHIWLTYRRTVRVPVSGTAREVTFVDHAEQDLSPVKW